MSSIVDVYLHGSVHLTNPGSEELFIGILAREPHTAEWPQKGPADQALRRLLFQVEVARLGLGY